MFAPDFALQISRISTPKYGPLKLHNVRYWQLAAMTPVSGNVRFLQENRTFGRAAAMSANDPKRKGQARLGNPHGVSPRPELRFGCTSILANAASSPRFELSIDLAVS